MKQDSPSPSAYKAALMRAGHQVFDHPVVFEDPLALRVVGARGEREIRSQARKFRTRLHSLLRAIVVARARFAEDELAAAVARGVRQYVILGAGLDTFAYRNPHAAVGLKVFEVDHPATQEWKRRQLQAAEIPIPQNLAFAPVDFERQALAGRLREAGFRADAPSFFSWLGVTMYLTRETMLTTMKQISSSTPTGSAVVFDYMAPPSSRNLLRRLVFHLLAGRMAHAGEPWRGFHAPESLVTDLKTIEFSQAEDMGPAEINARFFRDRTDHLRVGPSAHLMRARR